MRVREVLAYLVLRQPRRVSVDELIGALWGESPPRSAHNSVQRFVSDLRRSLAAGADRVVTIEAGYRIELGPDDEIDADEARKSLVTSRAAVSDGDPVVTSVGRPCAASAVLKNRLAAMRFRRFET